MTDSENNADRRPNPSPSREAPIVRTIPELTNLLRQNLPDLLSADGHSQDFRNSRAIHISRQIFYLAFIAAILLVLWIPVDLFMLRGNAVLAVPITRIIFALVLVLIARRAARAHALREAQTLNAGFILTLAAFYLVTQIILGSDQSPDVAFGYSLFPHISVVMLAIFPQTLRESFRVLSIVLLALLLRHIWLGSFFSFHAASDVWLFSILSAVAVWAQMAHLNVLLRLFRQATLDPLTGLRNRRAFAESARQMIEIATEDGKSGGILVMDLDRFKRINDTYGHVSGDRVLRSFASTLKSSIEPTMLAGRFGGEEFIVLIPDGDSDALRETAEQVRKACESMAVFSVTGAPIPVTLSIGVTAFTSAEPIEAMFSRADEALYQAKRNGRNRVEFA